MSSNLKNNTTTIQEILEMVNTLPEAGGSGGDTTTVEQATPTISVSSSGLITASATQTAGYVSAGTKSATKQLATQAAQIITPGKLDKTISSGKYLTGTQTIKGDKNLDAGNIKSGVRIFDVVGSYVASGGGDGLPDGISAIACGSFTQTEDIASKYAVAHGLGVTPNFWTVAAVCPVNLASHPNSMLSQFFAKGSVTASKGNTIIGRISISYSTSAGSNCASAGEYETSSNPASDTSSIYVRANSSRKIAAGITYIWIAGIIDGLN